MSTPQHNPIDSPETHNGFFTPESSPSPSNSDGIQDDQSISISIQKFYQDANKARGCKKKYALIYHDEYNLVEGFIRSGVTDWGKGQGVTYWYTSDMNVTDDICKFSNKPNEYLDYINMIHDKAKFKGKHVHTWKRDMIRSMYLTPRDWELLKRAKKIEWDNGPSKAWISSEMVSK